MIFFANCGLPSSVSQLLLSLIVACSVRPGKILVWFLFLEVSGSVRKLAKMGRNQYFPSPVQ